MFEQAVVASGPPGSLAVAAGSTHAVDAAMRVLVAGGNAVDAVLAAGVATPVCEPVLSSLAGGAFVLFAPDGEDPQLLDCFVDVPGLAGAPDTPNVETVSVHFGDSAEQVFHAGWGTVATPGALPGYLDAHRRWGRASLHDVFAPAVGFARDGIQLDDVQVQFLHVVRNVLSVTPQSESLYRDASTTGRFANPEYAVVLSLILNDAEGAQAFLHHLANAVTRHGGILSTDDVDAYQPQLREPLSTTHHGARIWTNSPPSFGGSIITTALDLLAQLDSPTWNDVALALQRATQAQRSVTDVSRGTTHVSAIDAEGNVAALTTSNGSGSGTVVDGVQLNNMLGEEDLNAAIREHGIGAIAELAPGVRMGSMMAPTMCRLEDGTFLALGTGGSERIRSALVNTLVRVIDHGQNLAEAVNAPRVHVANDVVDVEPGLGEEITALPVQIWPAPNLYFGGVHGVVRAPDGSITAVADRRRGGHVAVLR